jgi:hypothetical protein
MDNINQEIKLTLSDLMDGLKSDVDNTSKMVDILIMKMDEINTIVNDENITDREEAVLSSNEIDNLSLSEKILKVQIREIKEVLESFKLQLNSQDKWIITGIRQQIYQELKVKVKEEMKEEMRNKKKK